MPRSLLLLLLSGSVPTLSESDRQQLDALGPVALGKDGSLHRLSNWAELTAGERETAGRLIAARNEKRRTRLLEEQARGVEAQYLSVARNIHAAHLQQFQEATALATEAWGKHNQLRRERSTMAAHTPGAPVAAARRGALQPPWWDRMLTWLDANAVQRDAFLGRAAQELEATRADVM